MIVLCDFMVAVRKHLLDFHHKNQIPYLGLVTTNKTSLSIIVLLQEVVTPILAVDTLTTGNFNHENNAFIAFFKALMIDRKL